MSRARLRVRRVVGAFALAVGSADGDDRRVDAPPRLTEPAAATAVLEVGEEGRRTIVTRSVTWRRGSRVHVRGDVVFTAGAEWRIEPGVQVAVAPDVQIVVDRTSRALIEGTLLEPVVLACNGPVSAGCWGGVIIEGNAPINHGTATSPSARGVGASGCLEAELDGRRFGGCASSDSSGVFRFVRIEDSYLGLQFRGVGSGTVVDYVQVHRSLADGIRLDGGSVNLRHIALTLSAQFGLSWTGGYVGKGQYIIIQQNPLSFAGALRGANGTNGGSDDDLPRSAPSFANVTVLVESFAGNPYLATPARAVLLERGSRLTMRNAYVQLAPVLLDLDDAATCREVNTGGVVFAGVVTGGTVTNGDPDPDPSECTLGGLATRAESVFVATRIPAGQQLPLAGLDTILTAGRDVLLPDLRPRESVSLFRTAAIDVASDGFFTANRVAGASEINLFDRAVIPWYSGWTVGGSLPVATPGSVVGTVSSPSRGPLGDAVVTIRPLDRTTFTSVAGYYQFTSLPPGPYQIVVSALPAGCTPPPATSVYVFADGATTANVSVTCVPAPAVAFDGGGRHTCALDVGGLAYCWGANDLGQLGTGTRTSSASPVAVAGGLQFLALSAGNNTTCAVTAALKLYCWGSNSLGQLGIGDALVADALVPTPVDPLRDYTAVSVGATHVCAIAATRDGFCWGAGNSGQLGNGATVNQPSPVGVSGANAWRSISAGASLSCGIRIDGTPLCWGSNATGGLGNPSVTSSSTPVFVSQPPSTAFVSVTAGSSNVCALSTLQRVYCWGTNHLGQAGYGGTSAAVLTPIRTVGDIQWNTVSTAGESLFNTHVCGTSLVGTAYCWGGNVDGQLGSSTTESCFYLQSTPCATVPRAVPGLPQLSRAVTGRSHSCALAVDGSALYCWGANESGQLGDGTTTNRSSAVLVTGGISWPASILPN